MLISAIFHSDDTGIWTYVSMNDDYYRRRIGPVNILLSYPAGYWALVDYIIFGFHVTGRKGERRVPMGAADDSSGDGHSYYFLPVATDVAGRPKPPVRKSDRQLYHKYTTVLCPHYPLFPFLQIPA